MADENKEIVDLKAALEAANKENAELKEQLGVAQNEIRNFKGLNAEKASKPKKLKAPDKCTFAVEVEQDGKKVKQKYCFTVPRFTIMVDNVRQTVTAEDAASNAEVCAQLVETNAGVIKPID